MPDTTGKTSRTRPALAPAALLVAMTTVVYLPAANCGFIWDDDAYVHNNPLLKTADGLGKIWFQLNDGRGFVYDVAPDLLVIRGEIPTAERKKALEEHFHRMSRIFDLEGTMTLLSDTMQPCCDVGTRVDLLFSDFLHDPDTILSLLAAYLSPMNDPGEGSGKRCV